MPFFFNRKKKSQKKEAHCSTPPVIPYTKNGEKVIFSTGTKKEVSTTSESPAKAFTNLVKTSSRPESKLHPEPEPKLQSEPEPEPEPSNGRTTETTKERPRKRSHYRRFKPKEAISRLLSKPAKSWWYSQLRFTAVGRAYYLLHALMYFGIAEFIYEHRFGNEDKNMAADAANHIFISIRSDGVTTPTIKAIACLILGLLNANACLSEERSSVFFQGIGVLTLWMNFVLSLANIELCCFGFDAILPLRVVHSAVFLLINMVIVSFCDTDCSLGNIHAMIKESLKMPVPVAIFLHGITVALPIFVVNMPNEKQLEEGSLAMQPFEAVLLRQALFITLLFNVQGSSKNSSSFSLGTIHLLHSLPFVGPMFISAAHVNWPFSNTMSWFLFVMTGAAYRFRLLHGELLQKGANHFSLPQTPGIIRGLQKLLLGKKNFMLRRVTFAINCFIFLASLRQGENQISSSPIFWTKEPMNLETAQPKATASIDIIGYLTLFILGFINMHAVFSTQDSQHIFATMPVALALIVNPYIWLKQLLCMVIPTTNIAGSPLVFAKYLEALVDHFGFSLFTSYLNLSALSLITLLLLAMEVKFEHPYAVIKRGSYLVHGMFVILPTLMARNAVNRSTTNAGVGAVGQNENISHIADGLLLMIYGLAILSFLFGGRFDQFFGYAAVSMHSLILLAFFRVGSLLPLNEWPLDVRETAILWLVSFLLLRFRYLTDPRDQLMLSIGNSKDEKNKN